MTATDRLLTAREAMAVLGVSRAFLTRHAAELGGVKVGTLLRFTREGLDAYLERQRIAAPAPSGRRATASRPRPATLRVIGQDAINPVTRKAWGSAQ